MSCQSFHVATLGCKVNQYEAQAIREYLENCGLSETGKNASIVVVNTCVVTARAEQKCRQMIRRLMRSNPEARFVITGCFARAFPNECQAQFSDAIVTTHDKLGQTLKKVLEQVGAKVQERFSWKISRFARHQRAFLKVQDGCESFCSYCIVPKARGRIRSRPREEVLHEAQRLIESGYNEIVVTGTHVGLYGRDRGEEDALPDLIRAIAEVGPQRIRLSSIEPMEVTDRLLELVRDGTLCPHLHLPLQSGDDAVLRSMNRHYTAAEFLRLVDRVRAAVDRPAITSDVLVGFPGETNAAFENTMKVCERAGFSRLHVFSFSPRPGTPAAEFPDRVPQRTLKQRHKALIELAEKTAERFREQFVGETVEVLTECIDASGRASGYSERYVPVRFLAREAISGQIVRVRVLRATDSSLEGAIEAG